MLKWWSLKKHLNEKNIKTVKLADLLDALKISYLFSKNETKIQEKNYNVIKCNTPAKNMKKENQ